MLGYTVQIAAFLDRGGSVCLEKVLHVNTMRHMRPSSVEEHRSKAKKCLGNFGLDLGNHGILSK